MSSTLLPSFRRRALSTNRMLTAAHSLRPRFRRCLAGFGWAFPAPINGYSSTTRTRRLLSRKTLRSRESLGARIVEFDFEPFAEVARALYEGPWVAERYAAVKSLIESNPEALHPVTRAIIEGARKFDAVAAFEAFYRLADQKRKTAHVWSEFDAMLVPTMPRPTPSPRSRPIRSASIPGSGPTPTSSTCSTFARSPFPQAFAPTVCRPA